jgi:preprotein translocase subunit SecB
MNHSLVLITVEDAEFKHRLPFTPLDVAKRPKAPISQRVEIKVEAIRGASELPVSGTLVGVRVRAVSGSEESPYTFNVSYIAMYSFDTDTPDLERTAINIGGPFVFAFIRELVANLTSRTPYGAAMLEAPDFEALARNVTILPTSR